MRAKRVEFGDSVRAKMVRGACRLVDTVAVTLGPAGRTVILDRGEGAPRVTKDGLTVAREIEWADPFEELGARIIREAALEAARAVGDGTTTVLVLAAAMVREGMKFVIVGIDPMGVTRGMHAAVAVACRELDQRRHGHRSRRRRHDAQHRACVRTPGRAARGRDPRWPRVSHRCVAGDHAHRHSGDARRRVRGRAPDDARMRGVPRANLRNPIDCLERHRRRQGRRRHARRAGDPRGFATHAPTARGRTDRRHADRVDRVRAFRRGPILHPALDAMAIVPVSPHTLSNRSVVIHGGHEVSISLVGRGAAVVYIDGRTHSGVTSADQVKIRRSPCTLSLLKPPGHHYFAMLRTKLGWASTPETTNIPEGRLGHHFRGA